MSLPITIKGGSGNAFEVTVSPRGQLATGPLEFSEAFAVSANATNTAFNFTTPISGRLFVITGILLDADKNVSPSTAATVVIYEALAVDTATVTKTILSVEMIKNTNRSITGLNLIISTEGRWVNLKTTDASINATLLGYYVDA